ncbi:MAG: type 1 glutamine amidotransferase, partial [Planctomycetota bacterium]
MNSSLRFLLLQVRNPNDPMREHEILCFAEALRCDSSQLEPLDLIRGDISDQHIHQNDVVLIGGAGDFSVAEGGDWLERAMDMMRRLHDQSMPTFASCWGFQGLARALGGEVVRDHHRAEVGTYELTLTEAGRDDPVFGSLGDTFPAQLGHEDIVDSLPADAILLASSERTTNQAYRIADRPIYATQFHPELNREHLLARLQQYPKYVESVAKKPYAEFVHDVRETPGTMSLLTRFLDA